MPDDGYLLRARDRDEIARLAQQHEVWRQVTDDVLDRAGFAAGDRLLDLGCGPGFVTLDLASRVGPTGSVLGLDASELFVTHLRGEAASRGIAAIEARVGDVRELGASVLEALDGAFCRWLLMFLPDPERVIAEVAGRLRPGGTFAVMEYFRFRTMDLQPEGAAFRRIFAAVHAQIGGAGGDADVGGRVPRLLTEAGLEIVDLYPVLRVGRPGTRLWTWLEGTDTHHGQLVESGRVTEADLGRFREEWRTASARPDAYFVAPPVLVTIARRPCREDSG